MLLFSRRSALESTLSCLRSSMSAVAVAMFAGRPGDAGCGGSEIRGDRRWKKVRASCSFASSVVTPQRSAALIVHSSA